MNIKTSRKEENGLMETAERQSGKARIGVYVCHCGHNIAKTVDCNQVATGVADLEDVVVARDVTYACSEPGQHSIKADIAEHQLDKSDRSHVVL